MSLPPHSYTTVPGPSPGPDGPRPPRARPIVGVLLIGVALGFVGGVATMQATTVTVKVSEPAIASTVQAPTDVPDVPDSASDSSIPPIPPIPPIPAIPPVPPIPPRSATEGTSSRSIQMESGSIKMDSARDTITIQGEGSVKGIAAIDTALAAARRHPALRRALGDTLRQEGGVTLTQTDNGGEITGTLRFGIAGPRGRATLDGAYRQERPGGAIRWGHLRTLPDGRRETVDLTRPVFDVNS